MNELQTFVTILFLHENSSPNMKWNGRVSLIQIEVNGKYVLESFD